MTKINKQAPVPDSKENEASRKSGQTELTSANVFNLFDTIAKTSQPMSPAQLSDNKNKPIFPLEKALRLSLGRKGLEVLLDADPHFIQKVFDTMNKDELSKVKEIL